MQWGEVQWYGWDVGMTCAAPHPAHPSHTSSCYKVKVHSGGSGRFEGRLFHWSNCWEDVVELFLLTPLCTVRWHIPVNWPGNVMKVIFLSALTPPHRLPRILSVKLSKVFSQSWPTPPLHWTLRTPRWVNTKVPTLNSNCMVLQATDSKLLVVVKK